MLQVFELRQRRAKSPAASTPRGAVSKQLPADPARGAVPRPWRRGAARKAESGVLASGDTSTPREAARGRPSARTGAPPGGREALGSRGHDSGDLRSCWLGNGERGAPLPALNKEPSRLARLGCRAQGPSATDTPGGWSSSAATGGAKRPAPGSDRQAPGSASPPHPAHRRRLLEATPPGARARVHFRRLPEYTQPG